MTVPDPVEAIAEVIYESDWSETADMPHLTWAQIPSDEREDYRVNARAVVAYLIEHPMPDPTVIVTTDEQGRTWARLASGTPVPVFEGDDHA